MASRWQSATAHRRTALARRVLYLIFLPMGISPVKFPVFLPMAYTSVCPHLTALQVSTANYSARKNGVRSGMSIGHAKSLCPDLIVVPYGKL